MTPLQRERLLAWYEARFGYEPRELSDAQLLTRVRTARELEELLQRSKIR